MNILYLSDTRFAKTPYRDGSTRYRCYHFAEELLRQQHVADVAVIGDVELATIKRYDTVVILRPSLDRRLERVVMECRDHNVTLVADFDDLIFDPEFAIESPIVRNKQATEQQIRGVYQKHAAALQMFDLVTVATQDLCWHVRRVLPEADTLHLPNCISTFWLDYNEHVVKSRRDTKDITYMPGTRSHDLDFKQVELTLADFVKNSGDQRLHVIGALDIDESLFGEEKLKRGSWIDYFALPRAIADSWVSIAPLADTVFNKCKSHVKFIESAAFGTPIISSICPDIAQHGVDGLSLCATAEEWTAELQRYQNEEYYRHCSSVLRQYARTHCMPAQPTADFLTFIDRSNADYNHEYFTSISKAG